MATRSSARPPGQQIFWLAEGFSFGITAAGGAGYYLAQRMAEGEAEIDMWSLDPRRFGNWMTRAYAARKNEEAYAHVYILHHPDEEREACRPLRTAPCYERMRDRGAVFGQVNGWERPNYFAESPGFDDHGSRSFRRGKWWGFAEREARAVRSGIGLFDATAFAKHRVRGAGASAFLDWLTCNRLPAPGRIGLSYGLTEAGTHPNRIHPFWVSGRMTTTWLRLARHKPMTTTTSAGKRLLPRRGLGALRSRRSPTKWGVFALAGPKSRHLLRRIVHAP